ncbi:MAG TPA: copper resistance CopC family protein [Pseudonocardiaceae bacterium]|nr:copper resistance CopC family protein [Pseudonocardiaceae bacterium]
MALAAGVALLLLTVDHDRAAVTSTSPAGGATLAQAPTGVDLAFTGPVDPNRSHVLVTDGSGAPLTTGALRQTGPQRLSQPISVPAAGEVTVDYHVTFTDGAALTGSWRFTVGSGSLGSGRLAPASGHQHDIDPVSAGLLLADGITVLAVLVLLLRRPRRRASGSESKASGQVPESA